MPGPGRYRNTKRFSRPLATARSQLPSTTTNGAPNAAGNIASVMTFNEAVESICAHLKLPNLATRAGLKKVHENFDAIHRRIDRFYQAHRRNITSACVIIGIYTKMCTDVILKKKLIQKGILDQIVPLLADPQGLPFAARSLCAISHSSNDIKDVQLKIAAETPSMAAALANNAESPRICAYLVCAISHGLHSIIIEQGADRRLYNKIEPTFPSLVKAIFKVLKGPGSSDMAMEHALQLVAFLALDRQFDIKFPGALDFLVAGLRSPDIFSRGACLLGIVGHHEHDEESETFQYNDPSATMKKLASQPPEPLRTLCEEYGRERCDHYRIVRSAIINEAAFRRYADDRDLCKLGSELANCILQSQVGVFGLTMEAITGRAAADLGMPFNFWHDALPYCVEAIRARKLPADRYEDMADTLWLSHLKLHGQYFPAAEYAKRALVRSPNNGHFYATMASCYGVESADGLRAAKKGLRCLNSGPEIINDFSRAKLTLLDRAVEHAGNMGIAIFMTRPNDGPKGEEGLAFLIGALEDARLFMEESPPDDRNRTNVIYWAILLTFFLDGPKVSPDMKEIEPYLQQLSYAEQFRLFFGDKIPNTKFRLAQQTIVSRYEAAHREWGPIFQRHTPASTREEGEGRASDAQSDSRTPQERAADDLTYWLERKDDVLDDEAKPKETHYAHPELNLNKVELYRCSWCRNPSAALKKCAGCGKARYCDGVCQKAHWVDTHKRSCTPKSS